MTALLLEYLNLLQIQLTEKWSGSGPVCAQWKFAKSDHTSALSET